MVPNSDHGPLDMAQDYVAYYRVSTDRQGRSGLGLEAQKSLVEKVVANFGGDIIASYTDIESGKNNDRPEFQSAIKATKKHAAILIAATLDRISRDVEDIARLMKTTAFMTADSPHDGPLIQHIKASVAEDERRKISERTKAALAVAKKRGGKLQANGSIKPFKAGRLGAPDPAVGSRLGVEAKAKKADRFAGNILPIIRDIKERSPHDLSLRALADALNARGIKTSRGHEWRANSVRRVMKRKE